MSNRAAFRGGFIVILLGSVVMVLSALLQTGGSMRFVLREEVLTELAPETIRLSTEVLHNWPAWHRGVTSAQVIDLRGEPYTTVDQVAEPGELVRFTLKAIESKPAPRLTFRIDRYASNYLMKLSLVDDPSGAITSQFDELSWTISFPEPHRIRLDIEVHPITNRARLLCILAKPLVLANFKFPDIAKLAELKQPLPRDLLPQYQR